MRGAFDDEEEFEQRKPGRDAEFTLGFGTMLLLFVGLLVVCGVCFGLGYLAGRRGATASTSQQATAVQASFPIGSSQPKPSATSQVTAPVPVQSVQQPVSASQSAATDRPQSTASVTVPLSSSQPTRQVQPALPAAGTAAQPTTAYPAQQGANAAQQVRAASVPPTVPFWVQIAAVSHTEDADVLAGALSKRGYAVTQRREADNLIHVRIGPFTSHDEANRWRTKLLNDGYNAEVQQ